MLVREPAGVVAVITPWNVPQVTILAKVFPALIAGCCVVVKPAPETPLDGMLLATMLAEADLPPGVVAVLPGGAEAGQRPGRASRRRQGRLHGQRRRRPRDREDLRRPPRAVQPRARRQVRGDRLRGRIAGTHGRGPALLVVPQQRRGLRGAEPDPRSALAATTRSSHALADDVAGFVVGDPADPDTYVGPLVSARQHDRVQGYLQIGVDEGATVAAGGPGRRRGSPRAGTTSGRRSFATSTTRCGSRARRSSAPSSW